MTLLTQRDKGVPKLIIQKRGAPVTYRGKYICTGLKHQSRDVKKRDSTKYDS